MAAVADLAPEVGIAAACRLLDVPRSSYYRASRPAPPPAPRPRSPRALTDTEQAHIREVLNSPRFADCTPRQIYATLLDEGTYLCHWRTFYRLLAAHDEVRERRNQLRHPAYAAPELLATGPNQLWSWDITKLKGPCAWTYFYLYVILDVFSRCVVGWMVMERESGLLAEEFIAETCRQEGIGPQQLTLHADNGSSMTSKTVAQLLADLGVTKTHSRPHVSNDNPYSEAQFKTMKDGPMYPDRFASLADARDWVTTFVQWYNHEHRHSGLGLLTPAMVHGGTANAVVAARQAVLTAAAATHPARFVRGQPTPLTVPTEAWINPPLSTAPPADDPTRVKRNS